MKTAVLGTGSWGTALAQVLADNGHDVVLWGIDANQVNDINVNHHNSLFYPNELHPSLHADTDLSCIQGADILLFAVPSIALEETLQKVNTILNQPVICINVAKGFHPQTHERLSAFIKRMIPADKIKGVVSLIGPSHAEEVIDRKLTVLNAVCEDLTIAETIQQLFSNTYFRVYTNTDVIGAEIGVAVKNIMAIASGILSGIGQGDNARAALITRGLAEMTRYGTAMGGKMDTYLGLDGVGDLIVTCTSKHSRNFMAGYQIGCDGTAKRFMAENTKTVEGIFACKIVYEEAKQRGISMPITEKVYQVLYEGKDPETAIHELMLRELKQEDH